MPKIFHWNCGSLSPFLDHLKQLRHLHRGGRASAASNVAALGHLDIRVAYVEIWVHRLVFISVAWIMNTLLWCVLSRILHFFLSFFFFCQNQIKYNCKCNKSFTAVYFKKFLFYDHGFSKLALRNRKMFHSYRK